MRHTGGGRVRRRGSSAADAVGPASPAWPCGVKGDRREDDVADGHAPGDDSVVAIQEEDLLRVKAPILGRLRRQLLHLLVEADFERHDQGARADAFVARRFVAGRRRLVLYVDGHVLVHLGPRDQGDEVIDNRLGVSIDPALRSVPKGEFRLLLHVLQVLALALELFLRLITDLQGLLPGIFLLRDMLAHPDPLLHGLLARVLEFLPGHAFQLHLIGLAPLDMFQFKVVRDVLDGVSCDEILFFDNVSARQGDGHAGMQAGRAQAPGTLRNGMQS
mmetsp:Transcript_14862/g.42121  ORF Transcript_14862/g.42121 Transcript_14862/m.42121 type:complete len:275 (-) Transcript_14862:63-887(-)